MSMQEFFSEDIEAPQSIFRKDELLEIHKNLTHYRILSLEDVHQEGTFLSQQTYSPGAKVSSEWMVYNGLVAGMVIAGVLNLTLDGVEYRLSKGDGFSFSIFIFAIVK